MLLTGNARFMGVRSGVKNGKRWGNVILDANDNLLERVQIFVRDDMIDHCAALPPGSDVFVSMRLYSTQGGNVGSRLESIEIFVPGGGDKK